MRWFALMLMACPSGRPDGDADPSPTPTDTDRPPADTAASPDGRAPCLWEEEPNNTPATANDLPLEVEACGLFDPDFDVDMWAFRTGADAWLAVDVWAQRAGSLADVQLTLLGGDDSLILADMHGGRDVRLRMPAPAADWTAALQQRAGTNPGAGERFHYRMRASTIKAPLAWDAASTGASAAAPQPVRVGQRVFGVLDPGARHHFRVEADAAASVDLAVLAHALGSRCNFALSLLDATGGELARVRSGPEGWEWDPVVRRDLGAGEQLHLRLFEEAGRGGVGCWYVLSATEAE